MLCELTRKGIDEQDGSVLILVLMEDALRVVVLMMMDQSAFQVLILVLMEDALRASVSWVDLAQNDCLNPCSNGRCSASCPWLVISSEVTES